MLLKFFIDYPYIVYSILTIAYILIFIGIEPIKRLWPIAILGGITIFAATYWLVSIGLYKFNITFLPIFGIPFFHILWGAACGIVFAHYLGKKPLQRFIVILAFSGVVVFMEYLVEEAKRVEHVGKFNNAYEYVFDVIVLSTLAFMITNLFHSRLDKKEQERLY